MGPLVAPQIFVVLAPLGSGHWKLTQDRRRRRRGGRDCSEELQPHAIPRRTDDMMIARVAEVWVVTIPPVVKSVRELESERA